MEDNGMSKFSCSFSVFKNQYYFTPNFTWIFLSLIALLLILGIWQWQTANDLFDTLELINKRLVLNPIQADELDKGGDWRFYPSQLQGTFDDEHQILLNNRSYILPPIPLRLRAHYLNLLNTSHLALTLMKKPRTGHYSAK
jgi:hypothetical protein